MRLMQTALVVAMLQHRMRPDEGQSSVELCIIVLYFMCSVVNMSLNRC